MATNKRFNPESIVLPAASTYSSGDPIRSNGVNGVCIEDSGNVTTGYATVNTEGVWTLPVTATDQEGNTTVAINDVVYISSAGVLSRDSSGHPFGVAQAAVAVGATTSIDVFIIQDASDAVGGPGDFGTFELFETNPVTCTVGGGAASGTDTAVNVMQIGANAFEYTMIGTQTITAPTLAAGGLNVSLDLTANDGIMVDRGITARNPEAVTVGTDPASVAILELTLTDVSGTDDCLFGWRKLAARAPAPDDYTDMAAFNIISGDIYTETILNNAATTSTDTTDNWADAGTHILEVRVSAAGVVTFLIDGAAPTVTQAFTFDDGDVIIPFFQLIHDTDAAESTLFSKWDTKRQ